MNTFKNIGLIMAGSSSEIFPLMPASQSNGYSFRKAFFERDAWETAFRNAYPEAEIVTHKNDIIGDRSLDLIIISAPANEYADLIAEALHSGTPVRVIS